MFIDNNRAYREINTADLKNRVHFLMEMLEGLEASEQVELESLEKELDSAIQKLNEIQQQIKTTEFKILVNHYEHSSADLKRYERYIKSLNPKEHRSHYEPLTEANLRKRYGIRLLDGWQRKVYSYLKKEHYIDNSTSFGTFNKVFNLKRVEKEDRIVWINTKDKTRVSNRSLFILLQIILTRNPLYRNGFKPFILANFTTPHGDFLPSSLSSGFIEFKYGSIHDPRLEIFENQLNSIVKDYLP